LVIVPNPLNDPQFVDSLFDDHRLDGILVIGGFCIPEYSDHKPFPYNSIWFAGIYAIGYIPKLFLVNAIMKVVRNTLEGVKYIITTMVCSVLVVVWH
jgi:hypothetical protein